MKAEFCYYENFLTEEECNLIKINCKDLIYEFGSIYSHEEKKDINDFKVIKNTVKILDKNKNKELYNKISLLVFEANKEYFNFNIQDLQLLRYTEYDSRYGAYFNRHSDINWVTEENYHRKLTCVIQLTQPNEYDNGDLILHVKQKLNKEIVRKQGTAIIFPSFIAHEITPVTRGIRNSLVLWFIGPKFT